LLTVVLVHDKAGAQYLFAVASPNLAMGSPRLAALDLGRHMMEKARDAAAAQVREDRMEITIEGLKVIGAYRYQSGAYTPLDNLMNAYFWTPAVELLPKFLAPNLITLAGLICMAVGSFVLSFNSPDLFIEAPRWAYALAALTLFIYQTLDALDGKQARRTSSSSPLGQLFDHGCDSVSVTYLAFMMSTSMRLGFSVRTVLLFFSGFIPFWFAQWAEYHTHSLAHSLGWIGVTEAQLAGVACMLATAIMGPQIWELELGIGTLPNSYCAPNRSSCPVTLADVFILAQISAATVMSLQCVYAVVKIAKDKWTAALQTLPIMLHTSLGFAWCLIPHTHPRCVLLSIGVSFNFITCKLIVAAMSHMRYPVYHSILWPLPVLFIIGKFGLMVQQTQDVLLGSYTGWCTYKLYLYATHTIEEISKYLGIYAFTLGPRVPTSPADEVSSIASASPRKLD